MDKKEQIKRVRTADRRLRALLKESLKGPRAKENAEFLKKLVAEAQEEAKSDPAIYRIRIWNFTCEQFYQAELANLRKEVAAIEGIEITNEDSRREICLSFLTRKALKGFRNEVDIGAMEGESYEFSEHRRNRRKHWVFVTRPILWEDRF